MAADGRIRRLAVGEGFAQFEVSNLALEDPCCLEHSSRRMACVEATFVFQNPLLKRLH